MTGVVGITAGYLSVAGSSVVLLGAGPRILGPDGFSTLAMVWTLSTLFGLGLANPTELVVTRRISAGEPAALRPFRWLALWGTLSAAAVLLFAGSLPAAQNGIGLVPGTLAAVLGWITACWVRGILAGTGHLMRYALVLVVEASLRVVLVALALHFPQWAGALLTAAVGGPLLVAAGVGLLLRRPVPRSRRAGSDHAGEHLYFAIVSLAYQVCLNGPALALDWQVGPTQPALVGAFVAVSTVLRSPSLLVGGLSTQALVTLSRAWVRGDRSGYAAGTRILALRWAALVIPTTLLVLVLSPWLLPLYYGSSTEVPASLGVALAVSTVVATGAAVGTGPLFAAGRGRTAASAWASGAFVTTAIVVSSGGATPWLLVGLVGGPLLAAVVIARGVAIILRGSPTLGVCGELVSGLRAPRRRSRP